MRVLNNTVHAISVTFHMPTMQPMRKGVSVASILLYPGVTDLDIKLGVPSESARHIAEISPEFQRHKREGRFSILNDTPPEAPVQEVVDLNAVLKAPISLDDLLAPHETERALEAATQAASTPKAKVEDVVVDADAAIDRAVTNEVITTAWPLEKLQMTAKARGIAFNGLSKTQLVRALRQS